MRQVLTILLLCLTVCQATAQRISRTYQNQSLSEVLKDLNDASSRYEVSFIYNELEDFRVTATLHRSTLPNAVRQVVGFYPMRVTETDNVITVECIHKTDLHLSGTIIDEQGQPIAYANIAILNPADSTLLCGGVSNESGVFVIPIDQPNILARISYVGYKTIYKQCNSTEVGMIWMRPETQRLGEVVVQSILPSTRIEGDALVTNIKGTILEGIGTARDVLGRLPGIVAGQGGISVFGKGTPTIYINGRLMRNWNMLDQLQSSKIKKVELITNPGARYDATVTSVIRITTEREPGEGFAFDNKTTAGFRNYLSFSEQMDMNYRYNDFDMFAMLEYDRTKTKGTSSNIQNTWLAQRYMQNVGMSSIGNQQLFEGKIGFNYSPSDEHIFGAYYQASHKPIKVESEYESQSWIDKLLDETSNVDKKMDSKVTEHLVDGYYNGMYNKWSLQATFDILWKCTSSDELSREHLGNSNHRTVTIDDNSDARMIAGELHLSHSFLKGNVSFGTEMSSSRRNEESANLEAIIANNRDEVHEDNIAAYVETTQRLGRLNLQFGLRYEHVDSRYFNGGIKMDEQSRIYDNLFPTASLTLPIKKTILQLSYSKKYERPLYSQLSGTVSYVNRYLYQSGNPFLKSQYNDNVSFMFRHNWLILMANYTHTDSKIIDECLQYGNDATITLLRKENSSSALRKFQLMAVAAPHFGIYYPNLMAGVLAQDYKINYLSSSKKLSKPMFIVRWNNLLQFKQGYLANVDMNWRGAGDSENVHLGQTWSLNMGITKQYGKHWNVKLALNDIFNTSKKSEFTIYSGVSDVQMTKISTTRNIECTIRYNFNATKSKYAGKGAGKDEKNRL